MQGFPTVLTKQCVLLLFCGNEIESTRKKTDLYFIKRSECVLWVPLQCAFQSTVSSFYFFAFPTYKQNLG